MFWLVIGLLLFIFQISTILVLEFRNPSKTVAWLMILFVFPLIGFVMYYFLAKEYSQRRIVRRKKGKILSDLREEVIKHTNIVKDITEIQDCNIGRHPRLFGLLSNIPKSPITANNDLQVLTNGEATYDAILEAMEKAAHFIHIEYYIIRDDEIGRKFLDVMVRKSKQGVKVRLIYDGIGSYKLSYDYLETLDKAGVEHYPFLTPIIAFFDKRMNYRNHRKIVIVDGYVGFLGGINIGDEYLGKGRLGFWRDTHLALQGDSVYFLQDTFLTDWNFVSGQKLTGRRYFPKHNCEDKAHVQIISSGPDEQWDGILELYFSAIASATERIFISSPYFIPDESIIMGLKTAALSGVDVRIILPGIADSKLVKLASLAYVKDLLQAGVRFFIYQKGFTHAKILIADHTLASVGTANMDMRSFFSNFELNAVLFDIPSIDRLEADFLNDLNNCSEILWEEFEKRSRIQRGKEVLARLFSPLF